jgi:peptidyl-dipeptidase Dcp
LRAISLCILIGMASAACHEAAKPDTPAAAPAPAAQPSTATEAKVENPLTQPWTGPFGGVPPFDKVKVEHFKPALEAGMAEQLAAIERIVANPEPPTFQNTVREMERSGRTLDRVARVYGVWSSAMSTEDFQKVEQEMAPKLAAFADQIVQNPKLFARIEAVYEKRETSGLTPEEQRLVWLVRTNFVRAGAKLDEGAKKRVAEINQRLATLTTQFSQNVLGDENERFTVLEKAEDLAGLSDALKAAFAAAAEEKKLAGKWVVPNTRSAVEPFLTFSTRRDLRKKVWEEFVTRGDHGDARDNKAVIAEILALRAERAKLLGYSSHAHWRVEDSMAKTPERAMELMEKVWPAAVARVREEVADMQKVAAREGQKDPIQPWDYRYYQEKVRKEKYDLDENELKPYLQLDKLREAMFFVAGKLFDLHFAPVSGVPVYHSDVTVYEVKDGAGKHVGLWYFDPYARTHKQSGAWMNAYRDQERFDGDISTIVSNNANFVKAAPGQPVLIGWDDADTMFHEFGHALHGLCSNVTYPSLSGTSVVRDFVELPSQVLEHWLSVPEVLEKFALHYQTGAPMPEALRKKIEQASRFNQGFATVEYLASGLMDMKAHLVTDRPVDAAAFEKETLSALGMPREMVMRHRFPHFLHIFGGDGYSAGYYSYLWADTLSADAFEAFLEAKNPFDPEVAARLKKHVFSVGNTVDPAEAYRAFRGRDAGIGALMRERGFPEPKTDAKKK